MELSEENKKLVQKLDETAHKKNYHEETIELLIMLCYAVPMKENGYTPIEAMKKIIGFIQESKTSQECIDKTLNLAGIE